MHISKREIRDPGRSPWPDPDRSNQVALVERLLAVDAQLFTQSRDIARLKARLAQAPDRHATQAAPGIVHPWKLAENRNAELGLYDRRVDDIVLLEADRGAAFMARHRLQSNAPDFDHAVRALHQSDPSPPPTDPVVSIVIPVFGQLAHTLNCLNSLWSHQTASQFETIIVDDASADGSLAHLERLHHARVLRQDCNQGFIASCNVGAGIARGRFVVFLNNDTRVVDGWLDALVDSFVLFPKAGLVGSKLFYPDGRLQESGCIIWRDASCWNDGRNGDPNHPRHSHARQVDYVSGCSIMLRTELFHALGGFDAHFAPAYCEDADLALRVREADLEVWFQPQSRVIHYEGATSGTSTAHGVKSNQLVNGRKLFLRWREHLTTHRPNGQEPQAERERHVHKRALIIDANLPTPEQDAGSVTASLTLGLFQSLGYQAHFVPQDNFLFQHEPAAALMRAGITVAYAPYDPDLETYLRHHGKDFDVIMVFRVTVLEQVIGLLRNLAPQAPILFHTMDLHHLRLEREARQASDTSGLAAALKLKARELDLVRSADCTITHSTFERDLLVTEAPDAPVLVWPFMFPLHGTQVSFAERQDFCFLGGYGHSPNVDAVAFFVADVLPLIHRRLPDARFIIAGANPTDAVRALAGPHVTVTGQIADLGSMFDRVRVFACSLRIGAGTKGKISAAMSYGVPVVSTSCGAEGMDLHDGEDFLLADTAEDFAEACLRLHGDATLWQTLSENGLEMVRTRHSLDAGLALLGTAIETAHEHCLGLAGTTPQNATATP